MTTIVHDGSALAVEGPGGGTVADAVILTTPAFVAAEQVATLCPDASAGLHTVAHASVAVTTLAYDEADVRRPLRGSGFLVPRRAGWLTTAGTFISNKWPALSPPGRVLVRVLDRPRR